MRKSSWVLVAAVVGSVGFAFVYGANDSNATPTSDRVAPAAPEQMDFAGPGPIDSAQGKLPPNHPAITPGMNMPSAASEDQDPATLTWKAPAAWTSVPNPNPMRLATYKIDGDGELVVSRAGGETQANIDRWAGQFDGNVVPKVTTKTIHDYKVTIVSFEGTYEGSMDPQAGAKKDWAMTGAIVETKGESYFFKLIGPIAVVRASQKQFDAMLDGISPK